MPDGLDPDDFIRQRGLEAFQELAPLAPAEYRLQRAAEPLDLSSLNGRTQYAIAACEILASVKNPVELENYLQKLSIQTGFTRDVLLKQIGVTPPSANKPEPKKDFKAKRKAPAPEYARAEAMLIFLQANGRINSDTTREGLFITPLYAKIAALLAAGESNTSILLKLPDDERNDAAAVFVSEVDIDPDKSERAARECICKIKRHMLKGRIAEAKQAIRGEADPDKRGELLALSSALAAELQNISIQMKGVV
jgi:DNA primase